MLESIPVVLYVIIVIVGISKEVSVPAKNIGSAYIGLWKENISGIPDIKHFFGFIVKVFPGLIAKIGGCVPVTNDLYRVFNFY